MSWIYELPMTAEVNDEEFEIRTDYRDILNILVAFTDPNLEDEEKLYVCLFVFYKDFDKISDYDAAYKAACEFIDCGMRSDKIGVRSMDWEQDAALIFPAVNKVAGYEVRAADYMHWWTFMGYFLEIRETIYATVLNLRNKKAKHKKLEKHEKDFWEANRKMCALQEKLTDEELAEKERLLASL